MFVGPWDTPPHYVTDRRVKVWVDRALSQYAVGKGLDGVQVVYAEESDGRRTRLVVERGTPVFESQRLEDVSAHLDIMALALGGD